MRGVSIVLRFIPVLLSLAGAAASAGTAERTQSDTAFRTRLRAQTLANCHGGATPENLAQLREVGISFEQLCTCAIDRYMARASTEQLRREQSNPSPPDLETASVACVTKLMRSPNTVTDDSGDNPDS